MTIPTYLPYYVLIGSVAVTVAILFGLRSALANSDWPEPDRTVAFRWPAAVLIGWFLFSVALGLAGAYEADAERIPTIQYGIAIPILIGAWLIWRSPTVSRIIDVVPQPWLIGVQLYRALGVIFLILYATDQMPGLFALASGSWRHHCRSSRTRRGIGLCARPKPKRGPREGVERLWHSRSRCRGHDRLHHVTLAALYLRATQ